MKQIGMMMGLCVLVLYACDSKFWSTEKTEVKTEQQEKATPETKDGGTKNTKEGETKDGGTVSKLHSGYDMSGKETTCPVLTKDIPCTMVFTPGDQYAADCHNAGGEVMMCDCHVYLCSKKL